MVTKFVTSDNHFFHNNIIKFQKEAGTRPFESVEEMNEKMIERWNKTVKPDDIVYIVGDLSFGSWNKTKEVLYTLHGKKHLIIGNHDKEWMKPESKEYFESLDYYKECTDRQEHVIMCHYPIARWNRAKHGSFHFHGHTHGNYQAEGRIIDVGIDNRPNKDYNLWEWSELIKALKDKPSIGHH